MLINSRGGYIGIDEDSLNEVFTYDNLNKAYIEENGTTMPTSDMFTGKIRVPVKGEYRKNARVMIRQTSPLPITVGMIIAEMDIAGGQSGG